MLAFRNRTLTPLPSHLRNERHRELRGGARCTRCVRNDRATAALRDDIRPSGRGHDRERAGRIRGPAHEGAVGLRAPGAGQGEHAQCEQSFHDSVGLHPWRWPVVASERLPLAATTPGADRYVHRRRLSSRRN